MLVTLVKSIGLAKPGKARVINFKARVKPEARALEKTGLFSITTGTRIVDMMINNSESLKLDLTAKDNGGDTGFQHAQYYGKTAVVNLIRRKMPQIAV